MQNSFDIKTIRSKNGSSASFVPELGAICSSLILNKRELLFQNDFFWDRNTDKTRGGIPFLFPICGRLNRNGKASIYLYKEKEYEMSIHGFADKLPWKVIETKNESEITFELNDSEITRKQFPFNFSVKLNYIITDNSLIVNVSFENTGDESMPFYAGFHPYFFTNINKKEKILFNASPTKSIQYNEKCTDVIGSKSTPELPLKITSSDLKDLLIRVDDKKDCQLIFPDNFKINISTSDNEIDFPFIQLYTKNDEPFFCVEPWMGAPNTLNSFSGSKWLKPNETKSAQMTIEV